MVLIGLVGLMVLFFSFQSLFTRLYSAHYAGPDAGKATSVFSVCYGVFIAAASFLLGGMTFAPSWQTVLFGLLNAAMLILYNTSMIEAGNRGSYSFLMVSSLFGGIRDSAKGAWRFFRLRTGPPAGRGLRGPFHPP